MGFTGLARWLNAPASGLQLITDNITRNHNGVYRGKWYLTVKSFRSALGQIPGFQIPAERVMCALTMNDKVFVLLDDPLAPSRRDIISDFQPTHYHHTFLTLSPPGALEQLLSQLKARWIPVRQSNPTQRGQTSGSNLVIDGHVFNIGNDWIVRVGNVILAGGAVKGMILEAEYLPLPTLNSPTPDGTSELLSNLLISVLPNVKDAKTLAITLSDAQWEDFESDRDEDDRWAGQKSQSDGKEKLSDGIHFYGDEEEPSAPRENDWTGVERDRRSAYLIIGFLRTETIL